MSTDWYAKERSLEEALEMISVGSHVYIGNGATTPKALIEEMVNLNHGLVDMEIIQFINFEAAHYLESHHKRFRTRTFFVDNTVFDSIREGRCDYTPISVSGIPLLVLREKIRVDVALIKVTPPNEEGLCSLGVGVDITKEMIQKAELVIAEVTTHLPWTYGDSLINSEQIDYWIDCNEPLISHQLPLAKNEVDDQIGRIIADQIEDGSIIRLGLGTLSNAVIPHLRQKKHLGLHTEIFNDGLMELIKSGVIDNSTKIRHRGKSVVTHAAGSQELYQFVNRNPDIEFYPLTYVNNWDNIGANPNMIAIADAHEVDVTGQVCSESLGHEFYGGFGGTLDFVRGAMLSEGGRSFLVLPSTRNEGKTSSIVFSLKPGSGVVVTRAEVDSVVTEYGVAQVYGKNIRERCLGLIEIAHPDFRDKLLQAAKQNHYISEKQPGYYFKHHYPSEWEEVFETKKGVEVLARPVKPTDEDHVRDFFHSLSDRSIYLRYFRHLRSLPHQVLQGFVDIDYSRNMSLIVLNLESKQEEIIAMGQWIIDEHDGVPELAFQVSDEWQGQGLGRYLMDRLVFIAQSCHIPKLKADVLADNYGMLRVFDAVDLPKTEKTEFGVKTYFFELNP
ncbi:GNAT family N-acetyltransferase [Deltaproteobacteria bacterium TL4]